MPKDEREESIASALVESMSVERVEEFKLLTEKLNADRVVWEATKHGLMHLARVGTGETRSKAIELIGVLRIAEAEPVLEQILFSEFAQKRLGELEHSSQNTTISHWLLTKLLIALVMISPDKWSGDAAKIVSRFKNSWIQASVLAVVEEKTKQLKNSGGRS